MADPLETQHHLSKNTWHNRYPVIFSMCRDYFAASTQPLNILSYGCSKGDECFTFAEYFPHSTIVGTDTNKDLLEICNDRNKNPNISFIYSNTENIRQRGPYDMIFCMSVFIDKNNFSVFEKALIELDNALNRNGLLVMFNARYRLSDTSIYNKYRVLTDNELNETTAKMDKNDVLLTGAEAQYKEHIFVKVEL